MNNFDEGRSVFNGYFDVNIRIDRPPAHVWKILLDDSLWVKSHDIENVSGKVGTVGFITRVSPKHVLESDTPKPHYHYCKVMTLISERQLILKTYTGKDGAYGVYMTAFDDTRLIAVGAQTEVTFNFYTEIRCKTPGEDLPALDMNASRENMIRNLQNLKRVVESE